MFSYRSGRGRAIWLALFLSLMLSLLSQPNSLLAASTRYVSPSGTDAGDCLNSASPCKTIQYAILQASPGDTVRAAAGTYVEHIDLIRQVSLVGAGQGNTFMSGNGSQRVLQIFPNVIANVSALTIENAQISGAGAGVYNLGTLTLTKVSVSKNRSSGGVFSSDIGGGIYNNGTLTLKSSLVADNYSYASAGGIYNAPSAHLILKNSTIIHNQSGYGAGIYNDGGIMTLTKVSLNDNPGVDYGGGIENFGGANATLTNVTFTGNTAGALGGAIFNQGSTLNLTNVTFNGNSAPSSGGGIYNGTSAVATLTNVTFSGNLAMTGQGGGIYNNASTVHLTNATFSGNPAVSGGGMSNVSAGTATLSNVTFSGNAVSSYGGGIYNDNSTANLINVTFSGNAASNSGGGIYNINGATTILKNTLVANSGSGGNCGGTAGITTQGHNLDSGNTCGFNIAMKDIVNIDPKLGRLNNNGGFTQTHALSKHSPAIDKGTNNGCPSTDQRGVARPRDGNQDGKPTCDIGAYEY